MTKATVKRNKDIRSAANASGVFLWEIAEKLDVSEPTFNRMLRKELSDSEKTNVFAAIEKIAREHSDELREVEQTSELPTTDEQTD